MREPPTPHGVRTFDELVGRLRLLRAWAGLSYHEVHRRVVDLRQPRGVPERLVYNTVYRCFQPGRSRLDVELLVDIARVLLGDDALAAQWRAAHQVVAGRATEAEIVSVSWSLPDEPVEFTGRRAELALLLGAAPVSAIEGMAGVGKTRLAIHAAQCLLRQGHGTDLQVWANLRGHDPDRPPADPAAVLGAFLRGLGVPGDQIYQLDLAGRAARYRSLLAGRRALIVLDNAATEDQVRPLLPDGAGCRVLITSRRALAGLPVAQHLRLDVFSSPEALELLRRTAGTHRIDAEPEAAAGIANLVGHLPLALGLVASRITGRPDWTLADHLARLVDRTRHRRLDDGVELALHTSYDALAPAQQRMFRLLALHPGGDVDAFAAAALAGTALETTGRLLDGLLVSNLLQRKGQGRYEFHDLVRLYANARAIDDEPDSARREALTRLLDYYLHTAAAAVSALYPFHRHRHLQIPAATSPVPPVADPAQAGAWLETERPNLLAAAAHAAAHGWPAHAHGLAATLGRHLDIGGHHGDAVALHGHALTGARAAGDRHAEATAHGNLGIVLWRVSRHEDAIEHSRQACRIFRATGDRAGEANALNNLGIAYQAVGRSEDAAEYQRQALDIFRELGHRAGIAATVNNLGLISLQVGRYDEAIDHYRQALDIRTEQGDRAGQALVLSNLGMVYERTGRYAEALDHHRQALTISRDTGYPHGESHSLTGLGLVYERLGRGTDAIEHHRQALTLAGDLDDAELEAAIHNNLGQALRSTGRPDDARRHHETALTLASDAAIRAEQARAHDGIAHTVADQVDQARHHWQAALTIYTDLGAPEAADVRRCLAGLNGRSDPRT